MMRTFEELLAVTEKNSAQVREQRRESEFGVNRSLEKGLESIQQMAKNTGTKAGVSEDSDENTHSKELEMGEDEAVFDEEDLMLDDD